MGRKRKLCKRRGRTNCRGEIKKTKENNRERGGRRGKEEEGRKNRKR